MFEWLPERIEQAQQVFQEFSLDWAFILNPPATETEIRACEEALGVTLPCSYREFLLRYNGANLFCTDSGETCDRSIWDDSGLIIYGTDNLVEFNQETKEIYTDEEWDSLIAFCYLERIGTGDFCGLDPRQTTNSEYAVLDCFHELAPADWRQARIASSFADWLARIFDQVVLHKKYPEYWFEAESSSSFSLAEETLDALNRQGIKKAHRHDYVGAIQDFNLVLLLAPNNHEAYYERGNVYFTLGNYQRAIEDFTHVICSNPQSVIAYNKRGLVRSELGDYQGAIEDFNQALQINNRVAEIYNNRGNARSQLGDRQGAMEDYQKAAELLAEEDKIVQLEELVAEPELVFCDYEDMITESSQKLLD
jgi:tetratricopeptide (TPR) repeat protein